MTLRFRASFVLFASALALCVGCSSDGDDGGSGGGEDAAAQGLSGTIPSVGALDGAFAQAAGVVGGRQGSQAPRVFGSVGALPDEAGMDLDLDATLTGRNASLEADLNAAGSPQSIQAFIVAGNATFLAWQGGQGCRLAWRRGTVTGFVETPCGVDGGLYCSYVDGAANPVCTSCDDSYCAGCAVNGTSVSCLAIEEPATEPEPEPTDVGGGESDVGMDTDEDPEDVIDDPEDTGSPDTPVVDPPDVSPPEPVVAECDDACLEENGGECCTDCNCFGDGLCRPVCGGNYEWDCVLQCCFDYDLLQCDCPDGSRWDREQECCATDGVCPGATSGGGTGDTG